MNTYVAFIRNVMHGRKGITKDLLVQAFEKNGAETVASHLTTGNLSFQLRESNVRAFKQNVEKELQLILTKPEPVFIYSEQELSLIDFDEIFRDYQSEDIYERCITFVENNFILNDSLPIQLANNSLEIIRIDKHLVFSVTRLHNGRPGSPNKWVEKNTRQSASSRNINTVIRILKYCDLK